jgi:hypothetical protein
MFFDLVSKLVDILAAAAFTLCILFFRSRRDADTRVLIQLRAFLFFGVYPFFTWIQIVRMCFVLVLYIFIIILVLNTDLIYMALFMSRGMHLIWDMIWNGHVDSPQIISNQNTNLSAKSLTSTNTMNEIHDEIHEALSSRGVDYTNPFSETPLFLSCMGALA